MISINLTNKHLKKIRGFTLIELMVVIVILGILATFVVPNILGKPDDARIVKAKSDIKTIESALKFYKLDNFTYPKKLQDLVEQPTESLPNWRGYLDKLPKDPWGNDYQYLNPGQNGDIDLFSYGADGIDGGEGVNGTIGNW